MKIQREIHDEDMENLYGAVLDALNDTGDRLSENENIEGVRQSDTTGLPIIATVDGRRFEIQLWEIR